MDLHKQIDNFWRLFYIGCRNLRFYVSILRSDSTDPLAILRKITSLITLITTWLTSPKKNESSTLTRVFTKENIYIRRFPIRHLVVVVTHPTHKSGIIAHHIIGIFKHSIWYTWKMWKQQEWALKAEYNNNQSHSHVTDLY